MAQSGPAPGSAVFNYVITALSKGGEMEDAIAVMKIMEGRGLRPDIYTYCVIMSGFAKGGLMDEAYGIYREAKKNHAKLSPVTYHILIRGYCKMEEYDKALNCLKEMKDYGVQPNADEYNKLIKTLCLKAVDWCTAEKLLEEMKESGLFLKGTTRSLITAVKELEQEAQSESVHAEA